MSREHAPFLSPLLEVQAPPTVGLPPNPEVKDPEGIRRGKAPHPLPLPQGGSTRKSGEAG